MNQFFAKAADILEASAANGSMPLPGDEVQFLNDVQYLPQDTASMLSGEEVSQKVRLLRAAARFERMFLIPMPHAPGLLLMGAEVHPATLDPAYAGRDAGSATGVGWTLREAFEACVGEGVEYLSQFELPSDTVGSTAGVPMIDPFPAVHKKQLGLGDGAFVSGIRLTDGREILLPADRCLRRRDQRLEQPPFALSTGCAAGPTAEAATLHGLYELIERDAAALWWRGGRRARHLPLECGAWGKASGFLERARAGGDGRHTWLLDITSDLGIPSVAAVSVAETGRMLACGTAARGSLEAASTAALREMCQMELAYDVALKKRESRGEVHLNATDRRHLARADWQAVHCPALHPTGIREPGAAVDTLAEDDIESTTRSLLRHLEAHGIAVYAMPLTRPAFGIPVVRVIAPDLQLDPCIFETRRLRHSRARSGVPAPGYPLY